MPKNKINRVTEKTLVIKRICFAREKINIQIEPENCEAVTSGPKKITCFSDGVKACLNKPFMATCQFII